MEIQKKQIYLINKAKNFIKKKKKDNFNTYDNSFCYFCPHS